MSRSIARVVVNGGSVRFIGGALMSALAMIVGLLSAASPADAATGDILAKFTVNPVPSCSGFNVGLAFDGSELLVSCTVNNVITRVSSRDGSAIGSPIMINGVPASEGISAMSWDRKNNQLWLSTANIGPPKIYTATLDKAGGTGTATLRFQTNLSPLIMLVDGLAYDGNDDTLWFNYDNSSPVMHLGLDGKDLGGFTPPFGANTGIAVAGPTKLYLLNFLTFNVSSADKDGKNATTLFSTQGEVWEDMECENATFAPKSALWIMAGGRFDVRAFEVPECSQGGVPGPVPPLPTSTPGPSPTAPVLTPTPGITPTPVGPINAVDAKIEIVFPHDAAGNPLPVSQSTLANVGAFLFLPNTLIPVPCAFNNAVGLSRAANSDPSQFVALGTPKQIQQGGQNITMWQWNDVDVSGAVDPLNKYYFTLGVDKVATNTNVWSHGEDARTIFPQQDVPTGVGPLPPGSEADARIEIAFPHDAQGNPKSVTEASLVNIGVDLFSVGTLQSAPLDADFTVRLFKSLNNDPQREVGTGQKTIVTTGGVAHPRWLFNDVDVSASQNPLNKYYFRVNVDGLATHSNVWSHGADARTIFPNIDTPSQSCQ